MARQGVIMEIAKNAEMEIIGFWYIDAAIAT
jgi:hypothetical protein